MPPLDFRVLCHLWRRWNPKRQQCNPSAESIARTCGIGRKTVFPVLRRLEEAGWIKRKGKPFGGSNNYLLVVPSIVPSGGTIGASSIVPSEGTSIVPSDGTPIVPSKGTGRYTREGSQGKVHNTMGADASPFFLPDEPFDFEDDQTSKPLSDPNAKIVSTGAPAKRTPPPAMVPDNLDANAPF